MSQDTYNGDSAMALLMDLRIQLEFQSECLLGQYKEGEVIEAHHLAYIFKNLLATLPDRIDI